MGQLFRTICLRLLSTACLLPIYSYAEPQQSLEQQYLKAAEEPGAILFTPPQGWKVADPKILPPKVKVMVIGKGKSEYPPSINLGMETYQGSLKDYLKTVKAINDAQHDVWKDLGTFRTQAGDGSLSQVDIKTEWGDVRLMHVFLKKNDTLYALTVAALKEEFPDYYKEFITSMRSLRFNKEALEMIPSAKRRKELQDAIAQVKEGWQKEILARTPSAISQESFSEEVFKSENFQKQVWEPFQAMLARSFADMNPSWHKNVIQKLQQELISSAESDKKN